MKINLLKTIGIVVLALTVGVGAMSAQEDKLPTIDDGRVNAHDLAASAVVYCTFDQPDAEDPDYSELASIEVWGLVTVDDVLQGTKVLEVTVDEIDEAGYSSDSDTLLASDSGYTLSRATDGSFYITAPGLNGSSFYTFSWELGDQGC